MMFITMMTAIMCIYSLPDIFHTCFKLNNPRTSMKHSKFFLELGNCCEKSITEMYILDKDQKYTSVKIYRNIIHVFTDIDCNGSICD